MKNSRLLDVIHSLEKKEVREFKRFISSSFFNHKQELGLLFDYIVESEQELGIIPTKEGASKKLFPEASIDLQCVRALMSSLLRLLEKYLSCQDFLEDEMAQRIRLAKIYRERNLEKQFVRNAKQATIINEALPYRNADFYQAAYELNFEQYQFQSKGKRNKAHNLQEISDNLDLAFILLKLRQVCLSLSHQAVYKRAYQYGLFKPILAFVETSNLLQTPTINVYYHCYHALAGPDDAQHFQQFKEGLFLNQHQFPEEELRDLFLLAINYCIKHLNAGDMIFAKEGLELYKQGLDSNILFVNGQLSPYTYRNIVAMAIVANDLEWTEQFIYTYKNKIRKKDRESMFCFCLARLAYQKRHYDEALSLLQKSVYKDLLLNLAAKTLLLKIYFELDEWQPLDYHLDAMQNFIRRKKIIGYHRTNYLNLIQYTKKLMALNPYDKSAIKQLKIKIENEEVLTERDWLLASLQNL